VHQVGHQPRLYYDARSTNHQDHLKVYETDNLPIDYFKLGSKCYRHEFKNGGVCIFILEDLEFFSISFDKYCKEKDIEVCAIKLNITPIQLIILAIYRSPSGNFTSFLKILVSLKYGIAIKPYL
jgi:hypothetical protein